MFTRLVTKCFGGTTLAAAALGVAAVIAAGTANAGSVDDAFLAQLAKDGITPPSSQRAINDAHAICTALEQGASAQAVYNAVAVTTGLNAKGAKIFAVDSASAYCPQYVTST
jgi:Protein of unknown function (DUF732)